VVAPVLVQSGVTHDSGPPRLLLLLLLLWPARQRGRESHGTSSQEATRSAFHCSPRYSQSNGFVLPFKDTTTDTAGKRLGSDIAAAVNMPILASGL
jgi:hypothetical protein